MDIANLALNNVPPQTLELLHPVEGTVLKSDKGQPLTITVYGSDSDEFRKVVRQFGNKRLNEKKNKKQTMEELEEMSARILSKVTVGWSNIVLDGETLKFSEQAAFNLYKEHSWIREQVDEFVNERSNFLLTA